MRSIMILSRPEAVFYCESEHSSPSIMISISDPFHTYTETPFVTRENNIRALLPLAFCDAEEPGPDVYGHIARTEDLMQREDALQIRDLLKRYRDCDVIVHCDAGMSRSAGVAAAIAEAAGGDSSEIFDSPYYDPNLHCYQLLRGVLFEEASEKRAQDRNGHSSEGKEQ